jgi:hypothetical protein
MAFIVKDRVQESSTTVGTGTFTLLGANTGFSTLSAAIGNGNNTYYSIVGGSQWEVGVGTVGAGTLTRDAVLSSSTGSLISFSAGTKSVFVTYPAGRSVIQDPTQTAYVPQLAATNGILMNNQVISSNFSIPAGYNGSAAGPVTVASGVTFTIPSGSRMAII